MSMGRNGSSLAWMINTLCLWEEMGLVWPSLMLHVFTCTLDKLLDFDNRENSLHQTRWRNFFLWEEMGLVWPDHPGFFHFLV